MDKSKIVLYALHGAWNTSDYDGVVVLKVADDIECLQKILKEIASSHGADYVQIPLGTAKEENGDRHYEISDSDGQWAKFYITGHDVDISESLVRAFSLKMEEADMERDVKEYLHDLYEEDTIEAWKYEYITRKSEMVWKICQLFNKMKNGNTSFNVTLELAVEKVIFELVLDDVKLEFLWEEFGDVLIDDDECILKDFLGFVCGTHREEVWHWFDEHHSKGVAFLMYG